MAEEKKDAFKKIEGGYRPFSEGYQPGGRGYQPTQGNLNTDKPPQGGSGVPPKTDDSSDNSGSNSD